MTGEPELVSVIVPVYNVEDYLPECLHSIGEQSYRNLEIILVDDGSTDGSAGLCDAYAECDARTKVIHQSNQGLWAARNAGQDAASGTYLFFPDADDCFHKDTIRLLVEAIHLNGKSYPLAICLGLKFWKADEIIRPEAKPVFREIPAAQLLEGVLSSSDFPGLFPQNQWNKLYRASEVNGLRSRNYARGQDRDYQMRLYTMIESAVLVEAPLYYWRQRCGSLSSTGDSAFLQYKSNVEMTFANYKALSEEQMNYRHLFLHYLFRRMVFYKNCAWRTCRQKEVFDACRVYERETLRDYITCRNVGLFSKMAVLLFLHCPPLTRMWTVLSHNTA